MRSYFLGKDQGKMIRIFSVQERKNPENDSYFDLELFFPGKGLFRINKEIGDLIKNIDLNEYSKAPLNEGPHISVHYEPSKTSLFINRTTNIKEGHNVSGIKNGDLFATVILKIFGETTDKYNAKEKHINKGTDIGVNFNSKSDTLVMFFLISRLGTIFKKDLEYPVNYFEKDFKNFKLTVLYRYFNMPPEKMTINFFLVTQPGITVQGLYNWQIYNLLNDLEMSYVTNYFKKYPERNKPWLKKP